MLDSSEKGIIVNLLFSLLFQCFMIHAKELIAFLLKQVVEVENRLKESTQMFEKKLSISEEQVVKKII